jgi:hypothetical protein
MCTRESHTKVHGHVVQGSKGRYRCPFFQGVELSILKTLVGNCKLREPIFNLMFSESTCSGVSKIRNQNILRALLA